MGFALSPLSPSLSLSLSLEKTTEALISIRKQLSEKETQLDSLEESDSTRSEVQADVDRLTKEADEMEHQWSATKEVCHREYGAIAEDVAAPVTEAKAKAEHDIKLLQDQIANLQRQLDAVSVRRKQMAADAEEQQQRLAEQGPPIDDDDEEDA
ncbi:hypothetical protein EDD21DRAFT_382551 [Dissophora ornata]|nr:hypothetical protein EDD21DRAFT_382551 [Dissophora ornata]